jgi:hypothetical protein
MVVEHATQIEAWAACHSSFMVGVTVGLVLASLCTPFVGLTNTLRMVLQAQIGSLAIASAGQFFSLISAYNNGVFYLDADGGLWALESALGAGCFSVGNLFGASCGGLLGTFLSIRFGFIIASDIEEEWTLLSRCAIEGIQRLAIIGNPSVLKRIVAIRTSALAVNAQTRVPGEHEQEVFLIRGLVSRANRDGSSTLSVRGDQRTLA